MRRTGKKILTLLLVAVMTFSSSVAAVAAPRESTKDEIGVNGIERFFAKNDNGTMSMNVELAKNAGYSDKSIKLVQNNIKAINKLVLRQGACISEDYSVTIYNKSNTMIKAANVKGAKKQQSKVVVWATGMVLIYMNKAETNDLYNVIDDLGWSCTFLSALGYATKAAPNISKACNAASFVGGITIGLYKSQINQVRKSGTGIIMYVTPMPDGGTSLSFAAQ